MSPFITFIVGFFLGTLAGVMLMCLLIVSGAGGESDFDGDHL